jgi:hypothetical protein
LPDLVVDYSLLESTAGSLNLLIEEFTNASKIVDSYQDAVADHDLLMALDAFANNWAVHRQDLLTSMQSVYQMATKGHHAYVAADDKLAQDIRQDGGK